MKRTLVLALVLVFALSAGAFARSLGLPNELINGSWEMGDDTGWVRNGGDITSGCPGYPGPAPGETDDYIYGGATNWCTGGGTIRQDIIVDSGDYTVDLSGYLYAFDSWGTPSWIEMRLLIDDTVVDIARAEASGSTVEWTSYELQWGGFVAFMKSVEIEFYIDGREANEGFAWAWCFADGIDLEESAGIVPEPCSMLALAGGLVGLVIRRRK